MEESGTPTAAQVALRVAPAYVIGDVHGHRAELIAAMQAAGLLDADEAWSAGAARVWFLGDFFDRGDDGVAVVDLVMRLTEEAAAAGGAVHALLGNHEILTLGMHRWGDTEVPSELGTRSFARSWHLNGGQDADQAALTDDHITWLRGLPVLARVDDYLLMHSDTVEYFGWGDTVEEINDAVSAVLADDDIVAWWDCWRRMTTRYAFRGPEGAEVADKMMAALGGSQIVHGHSVIADQLGVRPVDIEGPCLYADDKVLGIDGGVFVGGPCLVVRLSPADLEPEPVPEAADEPAPDADRAAIGDTDVVAEPEVEETD